jgi:hypothetical protein
MNEVKPTAIQAERELLAIFEVRDALMKRHAYPEELATEIATLCIRTLSTLSDDELVQVARAARRAKRAIRDQAIRAELRTGNADDVARRHHLHRGTVYKIAGRR